MSLLKFKSIFHCIFRFCFIMAQRDVLKKSDCDLPEANVFPGKWHRRNKTGSVEFDKKSQWVANECNKWLSVAMQGLWSTSETF